MGQGSVARTQVAPACHLELGIEWDLTTLRTPQGKIIQLRVPPAYPVVAGTAAYLMDYLEKQKAAMPTRSYALRLWLREREILAFRWDGGIWYQVCCHHDIQLLLCALGTGVIVDVETGPFPHGTTTSVLSSEPLPASRWDDDSGHFVSQAE